MTDTPAESAEAPRTPEQWAKSLDRAFNFNDYELIEVANAFRAALAARDAETLRVLRLFVDANLDFRKLKEARELARALLSEGKPGK